MKCGKNSGTSGRPLNRDVRGQAEPGFILSDMDNKYSVDMPGVEFLVDRRGQTRAVLISLRKHRTLWEDLYDAYLVQRRRREPRESLAQVKRLIQRSSKRQARA